MDKVASFLSGGEDSRVVAGMLPNHLKKEAFVFLDYMNREGKIAQKISKAYDLQLNIMFRKPGYYLNILPEASDLVGSGQQYLNAHTLGFHKECKLAEYDAVFGGFIANALLKGYDSRKNKLQKKLSAIYEFITVEEGHSKPVQSDFFKKNVLLEIDRRRSEFLSYLRKFRNNSLHEWFHNWPRSMGQANPGYLVNRRLFRIYEPFLSNEVIKLAAGTPMPWKLNRRLFHKAMRPYLKPAKWVPHGKGWLPYLSWWSNIPIRIFISACRRTGRLTGLITGYHGSWGERSRLLDSLNTEKILSSFGFEMNALEYVIQEPADIDKLTRKQQFNLLQTLYLLNRKTGEKKEVFFHAD
nr:asparagine synthase-related protein [Natronogracilivirga saccharolytica]